MKIGMRSRVVSGMCQIHGAYDAVEYFSRGHWHGKGCPICVERDILKIRASEDEEQKIKRNEAFLRGIGIPNRIIGKSFADYHPEARSSKAALEICRDYAENFSEFRSCGAGLILAGRPGTGKTHLSCSIALRVAELGYTSRYVKNIDLLRRVKSTYSSSSEETDSQVVYDMTLPDLLIIDEVGMQFGSDAEKLILFEVLNSRYEEIKPTIIISNLSQEELSELLGERVMDRMREGGGLVVSFNWASHR